LRQFNLTGKKEKRFPAHILEKEEETSRIRGRQRAKHRQPHSWMIADGGPRAREITEKRGKKSVCAGIEGEEFF